MWKNLLEQSRLLKCFSQTREYGLVQEFVFYSLLLCYVYVYLYSMKSSLEFMAVLVNVPK